MEPDNRQTNDRENLARNNRSNVPVEQEAGDIMRTSEVGGRPAPSAPKRLNKKAGLIIGAVIAALLLISGVLAYQLWYQNSDKVMSDAIAHLMAEKQMKTTGTMTIDSPDVRMAIAMKANGSDKNSNVNADVTITPKTDEAKFMGEIKVNAEAVMAGGGDLYFKVKDLKPAVDKILDAGLQSQVDEYTAQGYEINDEDMATQKKAIEDMVMPIVNRVEDKWIKVSAADLKQDGDAEQACFMDAVEKIRTDTAIRNEIVEVYKKNKFVIVDKELGVKNGSVGYQLKIDEKAGEAFGKAIETTAFANEMKKCDENIFKDSEGDRAAESMPDNTEVTAEVWITRWSHDISGFKMNLNNKDTSTNAMLDLALEPGKSDVVTVPSGATSIQELQDDISELFLETTGSTSLSI